MVAPALTTIIRYTNHGNFALTRKVPNLSCVVFVAAVLCALQLGFVPMLRMQPPKVQMSDENKDDDIKKHPAIVQSSGENWTLWDRKSILHNDLNIECQWSVYRPANVASFAPQVAPICLYPRHRDVYVSRKIMDEGRWSDCDGLTPILQNSTDGNKEATKRIHVEIGANIGSCVLQVLLTTDAEVFAFEPHPENLFHLTSTLMNMHKSYRNRVYLFPIALASERGFSQISTDNINRGNAQVQRTREITHAAGMFTIPIERLDDLLDMSKENHHITLMKMDAQGYECFILGGMKKTLQLTMNLVFEVEPAMLNRFKEACSPSFVVNTVKESGFTLYNYADMSTDTHLPNFDNFNSGNIDLVGKRE